MAFGGRRKKRRGRSGRYSLAAAAPPLSPGGGMREGNPSGRGLVFCLSF